MYDFNDNGYDSFLDFSKKDTKKPADKNASGILKTIESVHEQDELADAKYREEMREKVKKAHPLNSVWEAVEKDEDEEYIQSL